jgi:cytochrome oxidase Cu insertion factor (SCO1/SenC/PrrC family)
MDRHFVAVQRELAKAPELADVRLLTITMDPKFDTPAVLKNHAGGLGANLATWTFLTPQADSAASRQCAVPVRSTPRKLRSVSPPFSAL